ncbi:MAG: right-handed parallel beta-helix repeat-containing protein [Anaerolineae bacterium]|nr:right-handed parallel beta-helix repeat-containing protein [Thermoflexales bacterium]MDW8407118.1 right-handed parallel beta-helix repeat-containing protein [Anaerolineae bacterium]
MMRVIRVAGGEQADRHHLTLQRAVDDAAAAGGGVVEVPAGVYVMRDALHLRSGVRVVGEPGAVLLKEPSITVPLLDYLGYGHYEFTVSEPDRLQVGMGVHITDDDSMGFYDTVATIVGRTSDLFFIDRMLNHDYNPTRRGRVTTLFPIVDAVGVEDVVLENLVIDGNPDETQPLNGCRGGGVFLLRARRARLENVEVRHFNGDAISFQQCVDVIVRGCRAHHNAGGGIHPGSGSVRYLLQGNHVHDNGGCGVFYCLRTTHSVCEDNRLERNGEAGISIGERDTDHWIRSNVIADNSGYGIAFRPPLAHGGDRVRIEGNTLAGNARHIAPPALPAEIHIPAGLRDILITANTFEPTPGSRALLIDTACAGIGVTGNRIHGRPQQDGLPARADDFPPVGPAALAPDGARHLNIEQLPPWKM